MSRLLTASALALVTSVWCWVLTAGHSIWSFGIVLGYLDGGRIPLYPTFPVTYGSFFIDTFGAFSVTFLFVLLVSLALPKRAQLTIVCVGWFIGAWVGASDTAFTYQIDFGTTWAPFEAMRELFFHPVVTPFWLLFGMAGTVSLTRAIRVRAG